MKVAVCLSGSVKHPEKSLESIKRIYPNEFIKVFIHAWKIEDKRIYAKDSFSGKIGLSDLDILEEYGAEDILIENYVDKKKRFEQIYSQLNIESGGRNDVGIISMFYSIYRCNQLKKRYEKQNGMIFDKVVRMRFDSDFGDQDLILNPDCNNVQIPSGNDWGGVNDQFAIGPSKDMDCYSNLYRCLLKMKGLPYHPESLFRHYFDRYPLPSPAHRFDFLVKINAN